MSNHEFFAQRPPVTPTIYVYEFVGVKSHEGYMKVGYTNRDVETRVKEQVGATHVPYRILYQDSAMRSDGSCFMDHDVHDILERKGFKKLNIGDFIIRINNIKKGQLSQSFEIFGQDRSLFVFPLKWALTPLPPTGSLTNFIKGGHAKLSENKTITIYFYPEWK